MTLCDVHLLHAHREGYNSILKPWIEQKNYLMLKFSSIVSQSILSLNLERLSLREQRTLVSITYLV